jgi:TATA-binding protein-associated factor Taf7
MENTFQNMLRQFGLTEKIHAINADKDTLTTKLDQLDNTFDEENQARCFNHTVQLSAKALLKPFNVGLSGKAMDDDNEITQDNDGDLAIFEDEGDEEDEDDEEEQADKVDDEDDNIDELEELSEDEQNWVLEDTAIVRDTVTKVSNPITKQKMYAFSLLTILLI